MHGHMDEGVFWYHEVENSMGEAEEEVGKEDAGDSAGDLLCDGALRFTLGLSSFQL